MSRIRHTTTIASFLVFIMTLSAGALFAQTASNQVAKGPATKAPVPSASTSANASNSVNTSLVDLNTASKQALMTLPGINDVNAQKIIENRPYRAKTDLTQKKVISADAYAKIAARVVAKTSTRVSPGNMEKRAASSKGTSEVQKKYQ